MRLWAVVHPCRTVINRYCKFKEEIAIIYLSIYTSLLRQFIIIVELEKKRNVEDWKHCLFTKIIIYNKGTKANSKRTKLVYINLLYILA